MILKGYSRNTRRKIRLKVTCSNTNLTKNGLGLTSNLRNDSLVLLPGHFTFHKLWQIKLSLCPINNHDNKSYRSGEERRGEAHIDAPSSLLLEKQMAVQTERKVDWNNGQSGSIGEEIKVKVK